jgi:membrane carboxypeptidase/penicillin-binding protein
MKEFILKNLKVVILSLGVVATILIGALIGIILVYQKGFPQIKNLEELKPMVMTTVFNDQNGLIKEFAIEKRTIVRGSDIP